ncbi:carboxylate-amine ligase [Agromyces mariniharenae]|uniref:Putative glutamate--cysteine ligase 2 n=1 Tax=Agromyces mariniharenae TaxID=2604423 RepID=A0A5S4V7Q4_9MICO|nr:YbdK family carboxylate-amine ligase [Agromyces mariniharenae]TYL54089.1 YbdK family carboxylate-amine ligase [Agromyces mariniharenae]
MRTFGIEEEFQFLERMTLRPADVAADVYGALMASPQWADVTHKEFLASQVEHASAVFSSLEEARSALLGFRRFVAERADALGVVAASVGTPPQTTPFPSIADVERYHRIVADLGGIIADHQLSGLHVHVGVPDREAGVVALNAVRPWMPLLTAISTNSPLWRGHDTGYDSWRTILLRRWTIAGCPPSFIDAADYDRRVHRLLGIGGTKDLGLISWDVRLSEHLPTIEFRMADAQLDVESTLLVAALCRAVVSHALTRPEATDAAANASAEVPPELLSAALMHSAHHGMRADVFDPISGGLAPAGDVLGRFVLMLTDELEEEGDLDAVQSSVRRLRRAGTGAERQRAAFAIDGMAGVRRLLDATIVANQGRSGEHTPSTW